jgi:hypothetical protein
MKKFVLFCTWLMCGVVLYAQHPTEQIATPDSNCLTYALQHGRFHGHFRSFYMATDNAPGLSDAQAWAAGGGLRYESKAFHHFSVGIGGFFIYNLASSDLGKRDSITGAPNRYELPLFDVSDAENHHDIDRLEDLYLRYQKKHFTATLGKQVIKTPFINPQDGRMRPTGVDGLWVHYRQSSKWTFQGGWIYGLSPRGTVKWYTVAHSIGVLGQGVQPNGQKSDYGGHLSSKGIGLISAQWQVSPTLQIQAWNQYVDHIFNTALLETRFSQLSSNSRKLYIGLQIIQQQAIQNGGNPDPQKAYIQPGESSWVLSARLGHQWHKNWDLSFQFTQMIGEGRFLMPREWGREPFYTFMARERNEGLGGAQAMTAKLSYAPEGSKFKMNATIGYFDTPDVRNTAQNKYGLPDYTQLNIELIYTFSGVLKGTDLQFLYVGKQRHNGMPDAPKYTINKVNMSNYNLVLNHHF